MRVEIVIVALWCTYTFAATTGSDDVEMVRLIRYERCSEQCQEELPIGSSQCRGESKATYDLPTGYCFYPDRPINTTVFPTHVAFTHSAPCVHLRLDFNQEKPDSTPSATSAPGHPLCFPAVETTPMESFLCNRCSPQPTGIVTRSANRAFWKIDCNFSVGADRGEIVEPASFLLGCDSSCTRCEQNYTQAGVGDTCLPGQFQEARLSSYHRTHNRREMCCSRGGSGVHR